MGTNTGAVHTAKGHSFPCANNDSGEFSCEEGMHSTRYDRGEGNVAAAHIANGEGSTRGRGSSRAEHAGHLFLPPETNRLALLRPPAPQTPNPSQRATTYALASPPHSLPAASRGTPLSCAPHPTSPPSRTPPQAHGRRPPARPRRRPGIARCARTPADRPLLLFAAGPVRRRAPLPLARCSLTPLPRPCLQDREPRARSRLPPWVSGSSARRSGRLKRLVGSAATRPCSCVPGTNSEFRVYF
ncbi:hypothetical protein ZWY2020_027575 [Hordeum vulgare]|nr:hypothetical protein ZWY2020_027575 [Hordeum vulgare]